MNSGEQQTIKYPLSSLKKYSEKKDEIKTSKQPINNKRVFFHSITGEPFDPNDPNYVDSDYDIDDSYIRSKENKVYYIINNRILRITSMSVTKINLSLSYGILLLMIISSSIINNLGILQ